MTVLVAVVLLTLGTWSVLADAGVAVWKLYASVGVTVLLALAGLTRHPARAASIRALTGGWIVMAPYLLRFADVGPAVWVCWGIGTLVAMTAVPGVIALRARRVGVAV
jgi:hypothetical protein